MLLESAMGPAVLPRPKAFQENLSVREAAARWGSGAYLFETVPTVLYILARHCHEPQEAVLRAVNDTVDSDTIGALVGSAVGALHGKAGFDPNWMQEHTFRTTDDDEGAILRIIDRAV